MLLYWLTTYPNAVGERGFVAVQVSQKTQKIVAIVCGLLLLGVIVAILVNKSGADKPDKSASSQSETKKKSDKKTDKKEAPKKAETPQSKEDSKSAEKSKETKTETSPAPQQKETSETEVPQAPKQNTDAEKFVYTAEPGDSYIALARDAVEKYVTESKLSITDAQKLQVESDLAVSAGSPLLDIGQVITIEKSVVAATVKAVVPPEAKADQVKPVTPKDSKETNALVAEYSFTAVAGDSYSKLARTAIADYASKANLDLSPSQRIAAETAIIASAGFPRLDINQVVTYTSATIKDAVDASMQLTDAQLLNWQPYALLAGL